MKWHGLCRRKSSIAVGFAMQEKREKEVLAMTYAKRGLEGVPCFQIKRPPFQNEKEGADRRSRVGLLNASEQALRPHGTLALAPWHGDCWFWQRRSALTCYVMFPAYRIR
jgi:hypothetical protein